MQPPLVDPANLFRLVHFFDILAAVVFAVSGALVASRKGLDLMGFMWFAVITGVGGGTVRDLILNVPVFWVQNPAHVSACLVTAVVMHFVAPRVESRAYDDIPDERPRVIVAGFGRVGQIVARVLRASKIAFVALEHSAEQVDLSRRFGNRIYYGDPARAEGLRAAGAEHAEIFVIATDDPETNVRIARLVKRQFPKLR